jgi:hypothetical protein
VASLWPQRLALAASISLSISFSVRYSRVDPIGLLQFPSLVARARAGYFACIALR